VPSAQPPGQVRIGIGWGVGGTGFAGRGFLTIFFDFGFGLIPATVAGWRGFARATVVALRGLTPKTRPHPGLNCRRLRIRQATISCSLGILEKHSRNTSGVQAACSSGVPR
jgi:hypothetical protein